MKREKSTKKGERDWIRKIRKPGRDKKEEKNSKKERKSLKKWQNQKTGLDKKERKIDLCARNCHEYSPMGETSWQVCKFVSYPVSSDKS